MPQETPPPADDTERAPLRPVRIGRSPGRGRLSRRLVTAYFATGLVLLLAGTVAVVHLTYDAYTRAAVDAPVTAGRRAPSSRTVPVEPSGPLLERIGPQRLANGDTFLVSGEKGEKFRVTVKAGRSRRTGCDGFADRPKGRYLPTELRIKVLAGEPDVSGYDFRFQQPDGTWLNTAYGSNCEKDYGALTRRLVAGRTYTTTVVYDVPELEGGIVFVYPTIDVAATWVLP